MIFCRAFLCNWGHIMFFGCCAELFNVRLSDSEEQILLQTTLATSPYAHISTANVSKASSASSLILTCREAYAR